MCLWRYQQSHSWRAREGARRAALEVLCHGSLNNAVAVSRLYIQRLLRRVQCIRAMSRPCQSAGFRLDCSRSYGQMVCLVVCLLLGQRMFCAS